MIGSTVLNYRIERLIGVGGMGSVYYATNLNIDQKVAIKVLNKNFSESSFVRNWFKNEAKLLCKLDHPNIVKFLNFVENDEGIFLIMEYVDGVSLEDFITKKNGLIVEERVYELFDQILDAFSYAHKLGIVHRDIKPSNILLTSGEDGEFQVKILDFGIAGFVSNINEDKSWIVGTPSYMSPEQVNGEDIDQRSDIYSLGVLLHQMLTGRTPYDATTLSELMIKDKVLKEPLPRMREFYAYISEKLQRIVDKATSKDKDKRFQTCVEFRKIIKNTLKPEPISKRSKIIAVVMILILIATGIGFWDYYRTKVYYYKDYVEQWGVPIGIGEMSSSEAGHSHRHYKFEYHKYKLQRVSHVNSLDVIISDGESERNERPLDMLLFYGENGKISYIKVLDNNGKVLFKKAYNEKLTTVIFQYDDEYSTEKTLSNQTIGYVAAFGENNEEKGKISRWLLEYDDNGFVSKVRYAGFQNVLVGDSHGIFGRSYIRDEKGRVIEEHYLGSDGSPKATKWGMGIKRFFYDSDDNWYKAEYLTIDGKPAYDDIDGISIYKMEYDKYGNILLTQNCGPNGELMLPKKNGIAGAIYVYDEKGFTKETKYFGTDKKPCFVPSDGIAGYKSEYDANGFTNKMICIDTEGKICTSKSGYAIKRFVVDARGNEIESWSYSADDKLVETNEGICGYKVKRDTLGNVIEFIVYDVNKKPCLRSDGTAGYRAEYNEFGKFTKQINLDKELKPCKNTSGVATYVAEYDRRGNRVKISYYDVTGKHLELSNDGTAGYNSIYNDNGFIIEESSFDINNKLCMSSSGFARWTAKYDDMGNMSEILYFDTENNSVVIDKGYAGLKRKFDERGNIIEEVSIGTDGTLASGKLILKYKYDKFDNEIEFSVYDRNYNPAVNAEGYFKYIRKFNERNQVTEVAYFGKNGRLIATNTTKSSIVRYTYDSKGNCIQTSFFNTENKPCVNNEGFATHRSEYNDLGQIIRQTFFDEFGKATDPKVFVPEGKVKYDKWGNVIYIAAYDGKGNLVINPKSGWSVLRREYDIRGNQLMESYYDSNLKPIEPKNSDYSKLEWKYDNRGNIIERKAFNANGELRDKAYAILTYKYDEFNRHVETKYFDKNYNPCNGDGSWHKELYSSFKGSDAQICKLYDRSGSLVAVYKKVNGNWQIQSNNTNSSTGDSDENSNSIVSFVTETMRDCPKIVSDGIEISSAYLHNNTGFFVFRLIEVSMYNISQSEKEDFIELFKKYKEAIVSSVERGSRVKLIVNDKASRKLFEL